MSLPLWITRATRAPPTPSSGAATCQGSGLGKGERAWRWIKNSSRREKKMLSVSLTQIADRFLTCVDLRHTHGSLLHPPKYIQHEEKIEVRTWVRPSPYPFMETEVGWHRRPSRDSQVMAGKRGGGGEQDERWDVQQLSNARKRKWKRETTRRGRDKKRDWGVVGEREFLK